MQQGLEFFLRATELTFASILRSVVHDILIDVTEIIGRIRDQLAFVVAAAWRYMLILGLVSLRSIVTLIINEVQ